MKNGKLQIGLIGIGGIANQKHMPSLSQMKDLCELVAFCDIIKERAEAGAKEFGAPGAKVYTDYKELLADDSIDVVHVLTPNVAHAQIVVDAFAVCWIYTRGTGGDTFCGRFGSDRVRISTVC